jgi:FdhD protein
MMRNQAVAYSKIKKVSRDGANDADDILAAEEPLEIRMLFGPATKREQKNVSVTMRTPGNDFELATGFLFTEGIINSADSIKQISYQPDSFAIESSANIVLVELKEDIVFDTGKLQRNFYTTSSCGVCGKASIDSVRTTGEIKSTEDALKVSPEIILFLPDLLRKEQEIFDSTGGLHASALFGIKGNFIMLREDVGRHNALDKLIGSALEQNMIPLMNHILLLSGRASFELIQKAAMAGLKIVCAVGAPSSLALETAKEFGITLIGFLRENKFNIYANAQRIEL